MSPFFRITIAVIVLIVISAATIANAANTATISFQAPTLNTDGTPITGALSYRVYQGTRGAEKTLVGTITETSQTISSGLIGGSEYCWQVTAVVNGKESARSNEACKAFDFPTPETVTITVQ